MCSLRIFILLIFLLTSVITIAEDQPTDINYSNPIIGGKSKKGHKHHTTETNHPSKNPNKISGQCTITNTSDFLNTGNGPCIDMSLKLESIVDKNIFYTRTNKSGYFEFLVPSNGQYKLDITSKFYKIISPVESVKAGSRMNLRLNQL